MKRHSGLFALKLYQKINLIRNLKVQIFGSFYIRMALGLLILPLRWLIAWLLAALIHELGHVLAIVWSGHRIERVILKGMGAQLYTDFLGSDEWFCALAGPITGVILVMMRKYFPLIAICAFFQTSVNLLPLPQLDGGRMLKGLVCFFRKGRFA